MLLGGLLGLVDLACVAAVVDEEAGHVIRPPEALRAPTPPHHLSHHTHP